MSKKHFFLITHFTSMYRAARGGKLAMALHREPPSASKLNVTRRPSRWAHNHAGARVVARTEVCPTSGRCSEAVLLVHFDPI